MEPTIDHSVVLRIARKYASQLVGNYGFVPDDCVDLTQDLLLECLRRCRNYDPSRSGQHAFVKLVVRHGIASIIESRTALRRNGRICELIDDFHGAPSQIENPRDADHLKMDVERLLVKLPPELVQLAQLLSTDSIASIGRITGRSRATIYRRINELRCAFEAAGLRKYLPQAIKQRETRKSSRSAIREKRLS